MSKFVPRTTEEIYLAYLQKAQELRIADQMLQQASAEAPPLTATAVMPVAPTSTVEISAPVIEPTARPVTQPVTQPMVEPVTQPATQPVVEQTVTVATPITVEETPIFEEFIEQKTVEVAPLVDTPEVVVTPVEQPLPPEQVIGTPLPPETTATFDDLAEQVERPGGWRGLMRTLGILLWIAAVLGLLLSAFAFLTRNNPITSFGDFGVYYQRRSDMEPDIRNGSLIIAREMEPNGGVIGDDLLFATNQESEGRAALRRVVNVIRAESRTTYDTIALADRENTHEQFTEEQVLMKKLVSIPYLGALLDWLTDHIWWTLGAFLLSLLLMSLFRRKQPVVVQESYQVDSY
ncbi:MAG: hypothetical protein FWE87_04395 [Coriobacteriia bacterium]|nr:hypothetical protein [Coriobacteriia bacterium]